MIKRVYVYAQTVAARKVETASLSISKTNTEQQNKTQATAAALPCRRGSGAEGDFLSWSEHHADGCVWLASCDFLLVFQSDLKGTIVEL